MRPATRAPSLSTDLLSLAPSADGRTATSTAYVDKASKTAMGEMLVSETLADRDETMRACLASPVFVFGIWAYNYFSWGKEKDPYAQFRTQKS